MEYLWKVVRWLVTLAVLGSGLAVTPSRSVHAKPLRRVPVNDRDQNTAQNHLSLYLDPMIGFESNHRLASEPLSDAPTPGPEGSALWVIEAGIDYRLRHNKSFQLRLELAGIVRFPTSNSRLAEFLVELPTHYLHHLYKSRLDLVLTNIFDAERVKASPIFLIQRMRPGQTVIYFALHDTLRAALAYYPFTGTTIEGGPYTRIKRVDLDEQANQNEEPDYLLLDIGFDVSAKYSFRDLFSARLRYDFARRLFPGHNNIPSRGGDYTILASQSLKMDRHLIGGYLGFRPFDALHIKAHYAIRFVEDNGGYYTYYEHLVGGGVAFIWPEILETTATALYQRRRYSERNEIEGGTTTEWQMLGEEAFVLEARGAVVLTDWMQALVCYTYELSTSDIEDQVENHRVLAGLSFTFEPIALN